MASNYKSIKDNLLRCIQCGKCTGGCPLSLNSPLNIRELVYQGILEDNLEVVCKNGALWNCTCCSTCMIRCPKEVHLLDFLIGLRGLLVERGQVQPTVRNALESTFKHGNPWGKIRSKRSDWATGLQVRDWREQTTVDMLYFVGCTPAYDPRVQKIAQALVRCFRKAEINFATLGNEESCCGSEIRRMGEEGLFEILVEGNTTLFQKHALDKMVVTSPHCYNVFKNEYPQLGFEIQHYTQLMAELVVEKRLILSREIDKTVTYHDPCFLGKQNGVFEEPRLVLKHLPGVRLVEMERSRERSLCCGGGGGRMWVEGVNLTIRLAEMRVEEALDTGAEILVTACPFCLLTLEDAVKTKGYEDKMQILDLAELVAMAV